MTADKNWTPEPWSFNANEDGVVYVTAEMAGQSDVCDFYHLDSMNNIHTKQDAKANANRAVNCVNGCVEIQHPEHIPEAVEVLKSLAIAGHGPARAALYKLGVEW